MYEHFCGFLTPLFVFLQLQMVIISKPQTTGEVPAIWVEDHTCKSDNNGKCKISSPKKSRKYIVHVTATDEAGNIGIGKCNTLVGSQIVDGSDPIFLLTKLDMVGGVEGATTPEAEEEEDGGEESSEKLTSSPSGSPIVKPTTPSPTDSLEATSSPIKSDNTTAESTSSPSNSPIQDITCIRITTGPGRFDNGYLDVLVNNGTDYVQVTTPGINYPGGEVGDVLDECYSGFVGVQVSNSQTNAWAGGVEFSVDGKASYSPMQCVDCTTGTSTEYIVVDGDDNGNGDTECLNSNVCTLKTVIVPWEQETR